MTKVSIVIATHNRHELLPKAIASAQAAGKDVEVVVVDDASTAETAELCRSLKGIVYVRAERNQGLAGARNIGILASSGNYLSFLDDDDVRLPGSIDAQVTALESSPDAGMIYGQALIAKSGTESASQFYPIECPQGDVFWELLARNFVPSGAVVFRRACLMRIGLLEDSLGAIEDWDLWVRISELYPVIALPQPVLIWRQSSPGSGQMTSRAANIVSLSTNQFKNWLRLPRAVNASKGKQKLARKHFSENMANHLVVDAARALKRGKLVHAAADVTCLLRNHLPGLGKSMRSPTVR